MKVEYIDHLGSDLTIVNCARVSFDKFHEEFTEGDEKLIKYLAKHNHFTPFAHPQICLRVTVPIFVDRQIIRHTVGCVRNEVSRRYVDTDPEFYITDKFGMRAENKKQGAKDDEFVTTLEWGHDATPVEEFLKDRNETALEDYKWLIENNVAPEDARMVLPLNMYTSYWLTGSLFYYHHMHNLRSKPEAQRQTRQAVELMAEIIEPLFPYSWTALKEFN